MGLSSREFKRIFNDGFEQRYKSNSNGESELRCFSCGEVAVLKKNNRRRWRIICANGHQEKMIDFLVMHTNMRDGITDRALSINCWIDTPSLNAQ